MTQLGQGAINDNPYIFDPYGRRCLDWYTGVFDSVYFALHPFVSIPELDVSKVFLLDDAPAEMTLEQKNAVAQRRMKFFAERPAPATINAMEKRAGQSIRWKTICEMCGLADYADLCRAQQGIIGALRNDYRNLASEESVWNHCLANNIFPPLEDSIPVVTERQIATLLSRLNYSTAILSDEFGDFQCEFSLEELLKPDVPWTLGLVQFQVRKVYPPDNSLLVVVGFDTVITKICGEKQLLTEAKIESEFEGFWCTADTDDLWWLTAEEKRTCEQQPKSS